jgi:hypothetical protein
VNGRQLWREALAVIHDNPVLCLPVAWATVVAYLWEQLRLICLRVLPLYILQTHSVLGGSGGLAGPASARYVAAQVIVGLTTNGCRLAHLTCFYIALLMTAKMIQRYLTGVSKVSLVNWQVLGLSFAMYAGFFLGSFLLIVPGMAFIHGPTPQLYWQQIGFCLVYVVLALLFASPSLRLVAGEYGSIVDRKMVRTARIYGVLSSVTLVVLDLAVLHIHGTGRTTFEQGVFTNLFVELVTSAPLVLLFVAISLLAYEGEGTAGPELKLA